MDTLLQFALLVLTVIFALPIVLWMAGAIYFDIGRGSRWAWLCTALWIGAVVLAFVFWQPYWKPIIGIALVFCAFLPWWFSQKPSNDRAWSPNSAILPQVIWNGDQFSIINLRNTEYRSVDDYDPHYETNNYHLSYLQGVDILVTFWGSPWMSHPILVYDFGLDGRICISIEVRYQQGQDFSLIRSLYRQQEVIYIVCDERDAILRRTSLNDGQVCYLYSMRIDMDTVRETFLEYVDSINGLVSEPRWYNGVTENCTTSFYRQRKGGKKWDWRFLFNGKLDRSLYDKHQLDRRFPFQELKQLSRINEIANRAPRDSSFGDYIRSELGKHLTSKPTGTKEE